MSDTPLPPGPVWMTYRKLADALGLRSPHSAAARARRARWPKRFRNDTTEAEIEVPADVLAQARQRPKDRPPSSDKRHVTLDLRAAVGAAVAPLQATIQSLLIDLQAARATIDGLRAEAAAHQADAAEQRGAATAKDAQIADLKAAHEREIQDRRAFQQETYRIRQELRTAEERAAKAHAQVLDEERRRDHLQEEIARLKRELVVAQAGQKKRRWWWR